MSPVILGSVAASGTLGSWVLYLHLHSSLSSPFGREEEGKLPLVFPTGASAGSVDLCSGVFVLGNINFLSTKMAFIGKAP